MRKVGKTADKLQGALGLCRRAGKLVYGFDAVCDAAKRGEAVLVLLAWDASDKTKKNVRFACRDACPVHDTSLAQADIGAILNKPAGVLAVTDNHLAALCLKHIEHHLEEEQV